jgi:hypothetical protein
MTSAITATGLRKSLTASTWGSARERRGLRRLASAIERAGEDTGSKGASR